MKFLGLILIDTVIYAWNGFVFSLLWKWFAVPTFHLPLLTISQSIGVMMLIAMGAHQFNKTDEDDIGLRIFYSLFAPFLMLIVGAICS